MNFVTRISNTHQRQRGQASNNSMRRTALRAAADAER
jgi:hypothetical protein